MDGVRPRAFGARSILGDPRFHEMQKTGNLKVKFRESFRSFALAVLAEDVGQWFEFDESSPYMLMVDNVKSDKILPIATADEQLFGIEKLNVKRSEIPAVTHVDFSSRIQTVHRETNRLFYDLISTFKRKTGCPILINTSFNVRGESIACTPKDAFRCFMGTDLDMLCIGNCILRKDAQDHLLKKNHENQYELDWPEFRIAVGIGITMAGLGIPAQPEHHFYGDFPESTDLRRDNVDPRMINMIRLCLRSWLHYKCQ